LHPLSDEKVRNLKDWCTGGSLARQDPAGSRPELPFLHLPPQFLGESTVAGPLSSEHGALGIWLLVSEETHVFTDLELELCDCLLEPFAVALENDHRLRELRALREAAEADKRALLTKLGREEITETVVGAEGGLRQVMERVELVSSSDVPVLIFGETGSGKEVIARAIHTRSLRHEGPFIRVNCGAIPPELIDSELFGHEKGSFTGATSRRRGWFERADEGTLFLDEVAELPPQAQVRLLRVLEEGYLERVGGEKPVRVNVRIVAATHRDLADMVQSGKFREDLWYRIVAFPVVLPPLREREGDIPELARHFARRAASRLGLTEQMPSAEDIELLTSYHWPGNVRELKSVIERAAILGDGDSLDVADALGLSPSSDARTSAGSYEFEPSQGTATEELLPLEEAMRRHVKKALRATDGQIEGEEGAAKLLEINPHTLRGRMRKLDIDWSIFRPG
jgi:transcriptional regulator with GAF, ATPase, and Fis domain